MSENIGVAIVGTGFGQKIHLPAFQYHHRTEVVAIYHRDINQAKAIAKTHNIPFASDNLETILAQPEVKGVSISTPPFLHYEMAKLVLESGKHLLLEKPLNLNANETKELYHLATTKNLIVTPDFEFRFIPAWQLLKEYLQQEYVGKKRFIKIDWLVTSRAQSDRPWNWYAQKEKGGGALGALGSHAFDYISWLFGDIKKLCAHLSCTIPLRPDPHEGGKLKPVDGDDSCMIMLELADGTPCQISISSVTYHGRGHWLEIYGDKGSLILGSDNLKDYVHGFVLKGAKVGEELTTIEIPQNLEFPQVFPDGRLAPFLRVVDQWVKGIDQKQNLIPSLKEGVYSQLLMDLSHRSHEEKCWIDVPKIEDFLK
jgi:predicted dehydrogenase